jgi:plasmid replication initiation protein
MYPKLVAFDMAKINKERQKKSITLIKKSNDLIEARYMFDIWETRFFLSVLSQIHREDTNFQVYRIKYKDIIKTFGLKSNSSYDYLRQAARNIMDRKVAVSYEVDGIARETLYHIIRKVDYMVEGKKGKATQNHEYIDVSVEPEMKPLLLQLQRNFTAYDLRNVVRLSVYPIRIYELLKQYESIGRRTLKIDYLKKMFELTFEYPRFSNFYQKIVKPAIDEINDFTDLKIIEVNKIKENRNVVALQFVFVRKSAYEVELAHTYSPKKGQADLLANIKEIEVDYSTAVESIKVLSDSDRLFSQYEKDVSSLFGVTPSIFLNAIQGKTDNDVQQAIRVTAQAQKEGNLKNSAGFFIEALRQNFTNEKEEKTKKRLEKQSRVEEMKKIITQLYTEREKRINDKIRELTTENQHLTKEMIMQIEQNPYLKIFLEGKKIRIGRALELDDYRQDYELRALVKQSFIERFKDAFILNDLDEKIMKMSQSLQRILK